MRCAPFSYLCSYNQMRVDYLRLRMRLSMPCYTVVAELQKTNPNTCQHLHIFKRKLCTTMKSLYKKEFQGRGTFGRGGLFPFAIWWHKKWRAPFSNEKRFNHVKYSGKVIIRKIMSSCLGVANLQSIDDDWDENHFKHYFHYLKAAKWAMFKASGNDFDVIRNW